MKTIINTICKKIKSNKFNFENVMERGSYYGKRCNVMPLFCSYGQIGYTIETDFGTLEYDYEFNKITLI